MPSIHSDLLPLRDAYIQLNSHDVRLVQALLEQWCEHRLLTPEVIASLLDTIQIADPSSDWSQVVMFIFLIALVCLATACYMLLVDDAFNKFINTVVRINAYARAGLAAALSIGVHYYAWIHAQKHPDAIWTREAIHGIGALVVCLAALQLAEALGGLDMWGVNNNSGRGRVVVLLLACCYVGIGLATRSLVVLSFGMFTIGVWTFYWTPTR